MRGRSWLALLEEGGLVLVLARYLVAVPAARLVALAAADHDRGRLVARRLAVEQPLIPVLADIERAGVRVVTIAPGITREVSNVAILRDQLRELDADLATGTMPRDRYEQAADVRSALERAQVRATTTSGARRSSRPVWRCS